MNRSDALELLANVQNAASEAHDKLYANATCHNCKNPKWENCSNHKDCDFFQQEVTIVPIELPNNNIRFAVAEI